MSSGQRSIKSKEADELLTITIFENIFSIYNIDLTDSIILPSFASAYSKLKECLFAY